MRNSHFSPSNQFLMNLIKFCPTHCRNKMGCKRCFMLTLTTTKPRAHCTQNKNPTSRLTSHRLKTLCFLTETLTMRITPDGRQVHHLETLNTECAGANRQISLSQGVLSKLRSFLSLKAAGLYLEKQLRSLT